MAILHKERLSRTNYSAILYRHLIMTPACEDSKGEYHSRITTSSNHAPISSHLLRVTQVKQSIANISPHIDSFGTWKLTFVKPLFLEDEGNDNHHALPFFPNCGHYYCWNMIWQHVSEISPPNGCEE
jgi:hypothetical protein